MKRNIIIIPILFCLCCAHSFIWNGRSMGLLILPHFIDYDSTKAIANVKGFIIDRYAKVRYQADIQLPDTFWLLKQPHQIYGLCSRATIKEIKSFKILKLEDGYFDSRNFKIEIEDTSIATIDSIWYYKPDVPIAPYWIKFRMHIKNDGITEIRAISDKIIFYDTLKIVQNRIKYGAISPDYKRITHKF